MTAGKDISVVGFDNREVSTFLVPQLTTMEIPLPQFGVCAAEALLKLIDEEKEIAVQVNGKLRGTITVSIDDNEDGVKDPKGLRGNGINNCK